MIPKIIHYCWFGKGNKNKLITDSIASWKRRCPDYEIIEWNEDNYDISKNQYMKQAYDAGKWAFVSDYVRLDVLYQYGGIYLDTDVEVKKSFDPLLQLKGFGCFEDEKFVSTCLIAGEKGLPLFNKLLQDYENLSFVKQDGSFDLTINEGKITNALVKDGLILNNTKQTVSDFTVFTNDYFSPDLYGDRNFYGKSKNTYAIHYFLGSWHKEDNKFASFIQSHSNSYLIRAIKKIMLRLLGDTYQKLSSRLKSIRKR